MSQQNVFKFCLYVAMPGQHSMEAIANLNAVCRIYLADRHEIEIVDVVQEPRRALVDGIFMTPTLIRLAPSPVCRIVGTLSQVDRLLHALGLDEAIEPAGGTEITANATPKQKLRLAQ